MHLISKIAIANFRSIQNAEFPLTEYTPLVGYNNAGKSNIMRACNWAVKPYSLQAADYFDESSEVCVEVYVGGVSEAVLDGLAEEHRKKIAPHVDFGCLKLRRRQISPGDSAAKIVSEISSAETGDVWKKQPTGISASILALFPDPIFVEAMDDAAEDVGKFGASTTIGKLLKVISDEMEQRHRENIEEALSDVREMLSAKGRNKDAHLANLDDRMCAALSEFFPDISVRVHIPTPDFKDFVKSATVRVFDNDDDENGMNAEYYGHGTQRALQISLIKSLSDIKREAGGNDARTTIIFLDEPELYLHPQAIEAVRGSLRRLSGNGYQIVFSTHSANMIDRSDAKNVLLVRRSEEGTVSRPRLADAVERAIDNAEHQSELLFSLGHSSQILFSERVILAEGKTEQVLIPGLYYRNYARSLGEDRACLVSVGGKNNIPKSMEVLSAMGISTKAVVDLDFMFSHSVEAGYIDCKDARLAALKEMFAQMEERKEVVLNGVGLPRDHGQQKAYQGYERLAAIPEAQKAITSISQDLLDERGIWVWRRGTIEAHLGLDSKDSAVHHRFLENSGRPEFRNGIPDIASVESLLDWLRVA